MEGYGFSDNGLNEVTSNDIIITYTPSSSINHYSYIIIKDNVNTEPVFIYNNNPTAILLDSTGNFKIEVTTYDQFNMIINTEISNLYKIDKEKPIIELKNNNIDLKIGNDYDFIKNAIVIDNNKNVRLTTNIEEIDFSSPGLKKLIYTAVDEAGNTTTKQMTINMIKNNDSYIYIMIVSILVILTVLVGYAIRFIKKIKKEKRLKKYSVKSIKDNSLPLLESIQKKYNKLIDNMTNVLSKSEIIVNYSSKYKKYNDIFEKKDSSLVRFFSRKVFIGTVFIIFSLIIFILRFEMFLIPHMIISFILGFYTLDIIYLFKHKIYRTYIENDLLQAIIIMNNAFKSGRSITQAVDLVANELEGPISDEFKKISMELAFGLEIEVAFKRFSERVNIDEAKYLTSSLSILNKTGGNIIKVFDSIEKTLFNRKKLRLELKSLTGSSKLIMYVLILVPISFILLVNIINPSYFEPLFSSIFGIVIIGLIIILYITYIFIVRRVMKIRM